MLRETTNRLFLSALLLLSTVLIYGQRIIKGKILNTSTREPIAYANIGINRSDVGTISNADGTFSLIIPQKLFTDTLTFSSIGYGRKLIPVKFFTDKAITIYLNEKQVLLKPAIVSSEKKKTRIFQLGNRRLTGGVLEADTTYAGRAIALLIDNKEQDKEKGYGFPAYIESAELRILRNNLKSFKFRIRLNDVDSVTGQPGKDLLNESIVVESTMRKGWLKFNLSHLNYEIVKPFYITFEQILDLNDRAAIADDYREFITRHPERLKTDTIEIDGKKEITQRLVRGGIDLAGTFIGIGTSSPGNEKYKCYVRETSFSEWKKVLGIVTASVTLSSPFDVAGKQSEESLCKGDAAICRAEKVCRDFIEENSMNGVQVCVSKKNKIKWSACFGYAEMDRKILVTDSTKFRINSLSKSMTSLALIKLVAENRLDLDQPIQRYAPGFPVKRYPVTTRQLAGHLAGFRDYNEDDLNDYIHAEHYDNATQALALFRNDTLLFQPGTKFHYSVFGWNLIGAVIEGSSGRTYLDYMDSDIWKPLGLLNTCGDNTTTRITNRSKCYDLTGQENELGDVSYKYSAGGLLSTAHDLVKMGNELLHGTYIDPVLRKTLFQTQYTSDNQPTGYGLGWYIGKDRNGHRIWYHSGDSFSGSSHILIYPDDDMVVSFLANSQQGAAFDIQAIGEIFY